MKWIHRLNFTHVRSLETIGYRFLPGFIGPLLEAVMYLLLLGIAMMLLKYLQVGFVAHWSWWWVL